MRFFYGSSPEYDKSLPNINELMDILFDEEKCLLFLFQKDIFYPNYACPKCNQAMTLRMERRTWRCTKNKCNSEISIKKGSFFSRSKLPCNKIMQMAYFWLNRVPTSSIIAMSGVSSSIVAISKNHFRDLVADSLDLDDCMIGGPGIIVEMDESKIGKRKYNRGHRVKGAWVFGGIERTKEKKVILLIELQKLC